MFVIVVRHSFEKDSSEQLNFALVDVAALNGR